MTRFKWLVCIMIVACSYGSSYGRTHNKGLESPAGEASSFVKIVVDTLPRVVTKKGPIRGTIIKTNRNRIGYGFQGIPYAEPPLGKLRFMKPEEKVPWTNELLTDKYGPSCYMLYDNAGSSYHSDLTDEDCLYINLFVPVQNFSQSAGSRKYPVLYYFHGGGWEYDSPRMFPTDVLVDNFASRDIIFALPAYRLGAMGFWCTGTPGCEGNAGVWDIIHGLKWIQDEIEAFGGDPNRVTILGHSSSASGASLLTMSPVTDGLFQQAIVMSGSAVESDAALADGWEVDVFRETAEAIGCNPSSAWEKGKYKKVIKCMQKQDPELIAQTYSDVRPVTAPRIDGPNGIFPASAESLIANRRAMPMIFGTVTNEFGFNRPDLEQTGTSQDARDACAVLALSNPLEDANMLQEACQYRFVDRFIDDHPDTDHMFWGDRAVDMQNGISMFASEFADAASVRDRGVSPFLYSFGYVKKGLEGLAPWHSNDLTYLVGIHPYNDTSAADMKMADIYSDLFGNFVRNGNPTPSGSRFPTWEPLMSPVGFNYYYIDLKPEPRPFYYYDYVEFSNSIVPYLVRFGGNGNTDQQLSSSFKLISKRLDAVAGRKLNTILAVEDYKAQKAENPDKVTASTTNIWIIFGVGLVITVLAVGSAVLYKRRKRSQYSSLLNEKKGNTKRYITYTFS